jgi:hypothetical protein
MFPKQYIAGCLHAPDLQSPADVPSCSGHERVRPLRAQHVIVVQAGESAPAGVEAHRRPRRLPNDHVGSQHLVDRPLQASEVGAGFRVQAHDLSPRVDASICTAGAGQLDGVAQDALDRFPEDAGDRGKPPLKGETVERRAQVGNK